MNKIKRIIEFPYLVVWIIIVVYAGIVHYKRNPDDLYNNNLNRERVKELFEKYVVKMEKLKPHLIGIFWITILYLIIK